MAAPTGTFKSYEVIGEREDLEDIIFDISPMERPFMSNVSRGSANFTLHEWQTDALASASADNAVLEGDDATTDTATPTVRFGNYCQISDKVARVSGTSRATDNAGRADELSYQVSKRGREIARDCEAALTSTNAGVAGSALTARKLAGLGVWLWNNQSLQGAATGTTITVTSGVPTTACTDSTAVAFTEANFKTVIAACWSDGGDPNLILVDDTNKQRATAFSGIATQYRDNPQVGPGVIIGSADIFVSDFGTHHIVASRFSAGTTVYVLDTEFWEVSYLRPLQQNPLAKTGDSDRVQILCEYTLVARNPSSSGKIYTTT